MGSCCEPPGGPRSWYNLWTTLLTLLSPSVLPCSYYVSLLSLAAILAVQSFGHILFALSYLKFPSTFPCWHPSSRYLRFHPALPCSHTSFILSCYRPLKSNASMLNLLFHAHFPSTLPCFYPPSTLPCGYFPSTLPCSHSSLPRLPHSPSTLPAHSLLCRFKTLYF